MSRWARAVERILDSKVRQWDMNFIERNEALDVRRKRYVWRYRSHKIVTDHDRVMIKGHVSYSVSRNGPVVRGTGGSGRQKPKLQNNG